MQTKTVTLGRKIQGLDDESASALIHGLNITQLSKVLEMDKRDVTYKIEQAGVKPVGMRLGVPIYKLKDVMPLVVKPAYDIEAYLMRMNPADLPKHLSKDFWAGQRARQEYQLREGQLWPTDKVISEVGELVKLVRMSALLTIDTVERQVELTERQRAIIKQSMDGMLLELNRLVMEKFSPKEEVNEQDASDDL